MQVNPMDEEMCLMDSCTRNIIHRERKYFQTLTKRTGNILTVTGRDTCVVGSEKATIVLPMGTQVTIENALLYPNSTRTLLTLEENNKESLLITKTNGDGYDILERIPSVPSGLCYTYVKLVPHVAYKVIF
jgi:hypothetical protein